MATKPFSEKESFAITSCQGVQNPSSANKYGRHSTAGAPNKRLLQGLEQYCEANDAEEVIQAVAGSYVNEIELAKSLQKRDDVYMESSRKGRLDSQRRREAEKRELAAERDKPKPMHYFWNQIPSTDYKTLDLVKLNKGICLFEPQDPSQNEDPTAGHKDLPQDLLGMSVVLPHPKQRLVPVPKDLSGGSPRLLLTTGSCTHPNYNVTNRTGKKAKRHHQYGFCAVDLIGPKLFMPRLVPAMHNGTFIDLGVKYQGDRDPVTAETFALVLGDIHAPFHDPKAMQASYEMIEHFNPRGIFLHDLVDFNSINPHGREDSIERMNLAEKGMNSLERELVSGYGFLQNISELAGDKTIYVVPSNHDRFLYRWLAKGDHIKDPLNSRLGSRIRGEMYQDDSALQRGLEQIGKIPENVVFLGLTDDVSPWGYECAAHGERGINGSRGNLKGFKISYGKGIIGHVHALEVNGPAISVGTNSQIPLGYQKGFPSRSMHGNAVVYEGGLAQALPIIKGRWKK